VNSDFKLITPVVTAFRSHFGAAPALVTRAPGRVNLIGEHTDYNGGWVLPAAISFEVEVAAKPRTDDAVNLVAVDLGQEVSFHLQDRERQGELWRRYPQGVAVAMQEAGHRLSGMDAAYLGDVPIGAGLSSSAAVEVAFASAFAAVSGLALTPVELALLAHRAENDFVGVPSGIMDQFISALGRANDALLLNCASLEHRFVPINLPETVIVVMDTGVRRELARSEYGRRRAECEEALRRLRGRLTTVDTLSDVSPEELEANRDLLEPTLLRRARHVVEENRRTLEAAAALEAANAARVGALMRASHESLRDLYEVSSPELDALVEIAWSVDGVVGARMTGAGFGGCAVALVEERAVDPLRAALTAQYRARSGRDARVFVCRVVAGAEAQWVQDSSANAAWPRSRGAGQADSEQEKNDDTNSR
jgi:galactokinase